jgi:hypothetical protein
MYHVYIMSERLLSMFTQSVVTTCLHHLFQVTSFSRYFAAVTPEIVVSPGQDVESSWEGSQKMDGDPLSGKSYL